MYDIMKNMKKPELTVSGYRGIWGESLTPAIASEFALSFAHFTKEQNDKENPTILIGRDGRESGPAICEAIIQALEKIGVNIIYGDVLPTPTVLHTVRQNKYDGAIIVTASHNPIEYNGLKFVCANAFFTTEKDIEKIKSYAK